MIDLNTVNKAKISTGKTNLLKHLKGERLTARQAIIAHCCDCMGYYYDGKEDCNQPDCPLHPFMPYNKNKRKMRKGNPEGLINYRKEMRAFKNE